MILGVVKNRENPCLKYNHCFGQLKRRGIQAVHAEELEKVIAYNFVHMNRKEKELNLEQKDKAA